MNGKKTGIPTILKIIFHNIHYRRCFCFHFRVRGPGHCHSIDLEQDKEYFVLAAVYFDVYKPVLGEIEATQANLAEVVGVRPHAEVSSGSSSDGRREKMSHPRFARGMHRPSIVRRPVAPR